MIVSEIFDIVIEYTITSLFNKRKRYYFCLSMNLDLQNQTKIGKLRISDSERHLSSY